MSIPRSQTTSTLTSKGALDCLAVIPVDQELWKLCPLHSVDSLEPDAIRLEDGVLSTIKFAFRDKYGTPVPMPPGSSVYIGLTILELPTV
jgi:hypothetical protein